MQDSFFDTHSYYKDPLSTLYERQALVDFAQHLISKNVPFSLALIDIDNFKNINDLYGHTVGDKIITLISERLLEAYKDKGIVGRFGGDEFIVIVPEKVDYDEIWNLNRYVFGFIDDIQTELLPGRYITCTMGLSRFNQDGLTYDELIEKADKALYRGKMKGRSCFIIYLKEKHAHIKVYTQDESLETPMEQHNKIFTLLEQEENLAAGIKNLFQYLSDNFMFDHLALQDESQMLYSHVYTLSRTRKFAFIDNSLIKDKIDPKTSLFYQNDIRQLNGLKDRILIDECMNQGILSTFFAEVSYKDIVFGYLRCDSSSTIRIWQNSHMNLLVTAVRAIGMFLYFKGLRLDSLSF